MIEDHDQVVESIPVGDVGTLPDDPFVALAVPDHGVGGEAGSRRLCSHGNADRTREAEAERSRRHIDAGKSGHVGMPLEARVDGVEGLELLNREVAAQCQDRVEGDRAVALGEHEAVPVGPPRLLWPDVQDPPVQGGEHVGGGQRSAEVPALGVGDGPDDRHPRPARQLLELGDVGSFDQIDILPGGHSSSSYDPGTTGGPNAVTISRSPGPWDTVAWWRPIGMNTVVPGSSAAVPSGVTSSPWPATM